LIFNFRLVQKGKDGIQIFCKNSDTIFHNATVGNFQLR